MEESHLLAGVIIHTDWLTFNPYLRQLIHRLLHTLYTESKVTQPTCFRAVHTLRRIFLLLLGSRRSDDNTFTYILIKAGKLNNGANRFEEKIQQFRQKAVIIGGKKAE